MEYTYKKVEGSDTKLSIFDGQMVENLSLSELIKDKDYLESRVELREAQIAKARELGLKTDEEVAAENEQD